MSIITIKAEDLRLMEGKEGLILQGCGGDLKEWVNGINEMLTEADILRNGSKFDQVSAFEYDGMTCILYPFENIDLNMGKLAIWRLQTHGNFGGTWLSDFVPNRLGGFLAEPAADVPKPDCALVGQNGNIYNLIGIATRTLQENNLKEQVKEMTDRVFAAGGYYEALGVIADYVTITSAEEPICKPSIRQQIKDTKPVEPTVKQKPAKQQER